MYFPIIKETHSVLEANSIQLIQQQVLKTTRTNTRELLVLGSLDTTVMFVEFVPRIVLAEEDMLLQVDSCRGFFLDKLKQTDLKVSEIYATSIIKKFPELLQPSIQEKTLFNSEVLLQQPKIIICMGEEAVKFLFPKVDYSQMLSTPRNLSITARTDATIFAVPHPIECMDNEKSEKQFVTTLQTVTEFIRIEESNILEYTKKKPAKLVEIIEPLPRKREFSMLEIPIHEDHCALF
jgi:uracil-DNA glycosylase